MKFGNKLSIGTLAIAIFLGGLGLGCATTKAAAKDAKSCSGDAKSCSGDAKSCSGDAKMGDEAATEEGATSTDEGGEAAADEGATSTDEGGEAAADEGGGEEKSCSGDAKSCGEGSCG